MSLPYWLLIFIFTGTLIFAFMSRRIHYLNANNVTPEQRASYIVKLQSERKSLLFQNGDFKKQLEKRNEEIAALKTANQALRARIERGRGSEKRGKKGDRGATGKVQNTLMNSSVILIQIFHLISYRQLLVLKSLTVLRICMSWELFKED